MEPKRDNRNFNPFPGLRPFGPGESDWFYGRDIEMEEVHAKLLENRFVAMIGSAGCGKTSLINCGVIPLAKHSYIDGEAEWRIIYFRPGNNPMGNLAKAISEELSASGHDQADPKTVLSELFDNPDGIGSALRKFIRNPKEKVLLVIDQFEELFRLAARGKKEIVSASVAKFVGLMVEVMDHTDENIYSIISLRSDFIGDCSRYHGLTQLINNSNYLVPELNQENIRKAIEGPVVNAGARIDSKLVTAILCDHGNRADLLPALQHVMMRTWERWKQLEDPSRPLNLTDYEAVGRLDNAMSEHAEEIYESLNDHDRRICETIFRTITEKSSDNRGLRNPSGAGTIKNIAGCAAEELFVILDKFRNRSACFINPHFEQPLDEDSIVDLSQEILIRLWGRLNDWVEEEAESAKIYLQLSEFSSMYQQGKAGLMKPPDLQVAINWREHNEPSLAWAERYDPAFERAMVYLRTSERKYAEDEANALKLQKRRLRRIRIIASGLAIVALAAIGYMIMTVIRKVEADRMARNTETLLVMTVKEKMKADSVSMLAIEQKELADSAAKTAINAAMEATQKAEKSEIMLAEAEETAERAIFMRNMAREKSDSAIKASLLADENAKLADEQKNEAVRKRMLSVGKTVSVKSLLLQGQNELQALLAFQGYLFNKRNNGFGNDADIYAGLYNAAKQNKSSQLKYFRGQSGGIRSIAFIPGKNEFFTSGNDGKVLKWTMDGAENTFQVVYSGNDIINVLAVSPDANWLACGSENSSIRMIPLKGAEESFEMNGHSGKINSLVFSVNSKQLYSAATDGKVLKWEIAARTYTDVTTGEMHITSIDVSYNGNYIAGTRSDGTAVVWNPGSTSDRFTIGTEGRDVKVVRFNPDNNTLALGDSEGNVELWDVLNHRKLSEVKAHNGGISDIGFNPELGQMATAGYDRLLRIYDVSNPADLTEPPVTFADNDDIVFVIEFSPDSRTIIAGTTGGERNLTGRPTHVDYLAPEICNYVTRNLTQDEWYAYVGRDIAYEMTCKGKSFNIKIDQIKQ